ncbi:phosphatase PAP2 family protein [Prosthecochloris sp. GSB1]|uniref:phosphatase PAP2 family protein n=1 Tax=Prosthecochloris sp. GSB1 TaxID=281093 RepID=UPI000B8C9033|nr:phosphatase PAP2 family protein [Prosthecochloris sp. GSB1]ASQ91519.1 phosphatase PAP2 family protein [Prosthecochloris sp. GSB1]
MELLQQADTWLFQIVNLYWVHPAADDLMVFLTKPRLSGHIFVLAALFMVVRRGWRGVAILLLSLLAVGLADWITSGVFKPLFQRTRPCFILEDCRLLVSQSRSWSFASSHASNSAAVASMIWIFFGRGLLVEKTFTGVMIVYAFLVAWSRMYVGVHYPSDILAGALVGVCCAAFVYTVFAWVVKNYGNQNGFRL